MYYRKNCNGCTSYAIDANLDPFGLLALERNGISQSTKMGCHIESNTKNGNIGIAWPRLFKQTNLLFNRD